MGSSETLRSVIDAGRTAKRLDELSTARVIGKIAELVHAAQQKAGAGKAIGPITPASITIEANGSVKLGLAEPTAYAYSSPEQVGGADGDRRSDVFSLGAVMWEALTHEPLFEGSDAAVKIAVTNAAINAPGELNANIPAELSAICIKALARNPADRYQSTKVMAAEIEAVLDDAGYGDTDDKIAEYIATLGLPHVERKVQLSPPILSNVTPAQGVGVSPVHRPPSNSDKTTETPTIPDQAAVPTAAAASPSSKVPSILDKPPTAPPASMTAPSAGSLSIEQAPLSPTSFVTAAAGGASPKATLLGSGGGVNLAAALANAGTTAERKPEPKPEPPKPEPPKLPTATTSPTTLGFASGAVLSEAAKLDAIPAPPRTPSASNPPPSIANAPTAAIPSIVANNGSTPNAAKSALAAANAALAKPAALIVETPPSLQKLDGPPAMPPPIDSKHEAPKVEAKLVDPGSGAVKKRPPTNNPHPASVVSLPPARGGQKTGRESQEVLGGWGWGTDSHPALESYDGDDDLPMHSNRKPLLYAIGGGLALALIITVIAFAFGGSSTDKKPSPSAATKEGIDPTGSAAIAKNMGSDIEYGSNSLGSGSNAVVAMGSAVGSDVVAAGSAEVGSADVGSAAPAAGSAVPAAGSADLAAQDAAAKKAADEAAAKQAADDAAAKKAADDAAKKQAADDAAAKKAADDAAKKQAAADAKKQAADEAAAKKEAAKQAAAEKEAARKAEAAAKREAAQKEAAARAEVARQEAAKRAAEAKKRPPEHKDTPKTVAKVDNKEVEAAYRQGLQQFARGDTQGALASLRTSLAGNPNFAPTWRGLGLVFEKMGEKDQARSAFKRYLQLNPNANDADKIRERLEKL